MEKGKSLNPHIYGYDGDDDDDDDDYDDDDDDDDYSLKIMMRRTL